MNAQIDRVLQFLYQERDSRFNPIPFLKDKFQIEGQVAEDLLQELKESQLVQFSKRGSMSISYLGIKIQSEYGGWIKYLSEKKKYEKRQKLIEEKKEQKLDLDIRWTKIQIKSFWPLFIIALLGGIPQLLEWFGVLFQYFLNK